MSLDETIRMICSTQHASVGAMRGDIWKAVSEHPKFLMQIMGGRADALLTNYMARMNPPVENDDDVRSAIERNEYRRAIARNNADRRSEVAKDMEENPERYDNRGIMEKHISIVKELVKDEIIEDYKRSILAKFIINGQQLGDLSPKELFYWMESQQQKVTFMDMLLSGVSLNDNRPIKDIISSSEANKLWVESGGRMP